jgi:hypothetical protein
MKRTIVLTALFFSFYAAIAQQPKPQPEKIIPQLSTADQIALQSLVKTQQDAAKTWNDAEQQKMRILGEWGIAHSGFHIVYNPQRQDDPKNFSVEENPKPIPPTAPEAKPSVPAKEPDKK